MLPLRTAPARVAVSRVASENPCAHAMAQGILDMASMPASGPGSPQIPRRIHMELYRLAKHTNNIMS